jgi:hypothetical protein
VRRRAGKCEGRKSYPALVAAARATRAQHHMSLLKVSAALAEQGYRTPSGQNYSASAVQSMLGE